LFVLGRPDVPPGWGPHGRRGLGTQSHQWRALLPLVVPCHAGGSVPVRPLPEGFICPLFISAARSGCYRHFFTGGIANVAPGTQRKWLRLFPDLVPAVHQLLYCRPDDVRGPVATAPARRDSAADHTRNGDRRQHPVHSRRPERLLLRHLQPDSSANVPGGLSIDIDRPFDTAHHLPGSPDIWGLPDTSGLSGYRQEDRSLPADLGNCLADSSGRYCHLRAFSRFRASVAANAGWYTHNLNQLVVSASRSRPHPDHSSGCHSGYNAATKEVSNGQIPAALGCTVDSRRIRVYWELPCGHPAARPG